MIVLSVVHSVSAGLGGGGRARSALLALLSVAAGVMGTAAPRASAAEVKVADGAGCGLEGALSARLTSLLATSDDARVQVELARGAGDGVEVSVRGQAARAPFARTLRVASCSAAGEAALLLLSLLPAQPPPEPVAAREPLPFALSVAPRFDVGSLPGATAGLGLGARVSWARVDAWLELRGLLPRRAPHSGSTASARASLYAVGLGLGLPFALGPLTLGPTAGLELGVFRVRGLDLDDARTEHAPWVAALAGAALELPVRGAWSLRSELEAALPFGVPTYGAAEQSFASSWPCALRAALALQWAAHPRKSARAATQDR